MQWFFQHKQLLRNILAIFLPFLSAALQYTLWDFLNPYIWILFFPIIYISTLIGNRTSGILATIFASLLGLYFFAPPTFTFVKDFNQYFAAFVFLLSGLGFVIFHDQFKIITRKNLKLIEETRITESRHMEELLSLSEYKYSQIFDKSPYALTIATFPDSKLVAVNDSFLSTFEFSREEVLGKTSIDIGLNDYNSLKEIENLINEFGVIRNLYRIRKTKSGKELHLSLTMNPININGVAHLLTTIHDRTAQKQAEDAMQISETKFSVLFHKGSLPTVFTKAPDHKIVEANEAFLDLFGFQKEEVIGFTSVELGINRNVELRDKVRKEIEIDLGNKPYCFEQKLFSKTGKPIDIFTSVSLISFGDGKFILASMQDITANKKAESDLIYSKERYRTILDTMLDCVITINENGIVQSINQSTENTFGYAREELVGQNVSILMPEFFAKEHDQYLKAYKETGEKRVIGIGRETNAKRKDGSTFSIHLTVGEFILNGNRNFVGIIKDITATVIAREELNRHRKHLDELVKERTRELNATKEDLVIAKEKAEQANHAKTQFLASASHDLRQPLQAANMLLYLIEGKVSDLESKELVEKLKSSLDSLGELLNSLLDISKLDAGMIYPDKVGFPLSVIFKKIRNEMSVIAEAKGLALRVYPTKSIVYSDPKLLEQILRNLLSNAIKYTKTGRILVGVRNRGSRLLIQVFDTGIGIPEDKLEKIFEEFYQINNSARNRKKGIGLGLAIVRRLVKLMGHSIEVRSNLGRGSKFEIKVPKSEVAKRKDWFNNQNTNLKSESKIIVAIEDELENLETLRMLLNLWGHKVYTGLSANEALENLRASNKTPDLILADYRLENNNTGLEAIDLIRSEYNLQIPALLLTGDTSPDRLLEARASSLKVLYKPINPTELKTSIDQIKSHLRGK